MAAWWWLWTVFLSIDARRALADYLEVERLFDATPESTALLLSAASVSSSRPSRAALRAQVNTIVERVGRLHDDGTPALGRWAARDSS